MNFVLNNHLNDLGTYSMHALSLFVMQKSFKPDGQTDPICHMDVRVQVSTWREGSTGPAFLGALQSCSAYAGCDTVISVREGNNESRAFYGEYRPMA